MALSVIGAGFGRTGTDSLKSALERLGFGPCFHMHEVMADPEKIKLWRGLARGDTPDWDKAFAGFNATVDWPAAFYWRELADYYPEAKILLSTRDAEGWYKSMDKTILDVVRNSKDRESLGVKLIGEQVFGGRLEDRDHIIQTFNDNVAAVQAAFSEDRLLTYHIGDGWEPLCRFLGCDIPDEPYPHKNRPEEFHSTIEKHKVK